jgi:group I intron endonuclease
MIITKSFGLKKCGIYCITNTVNNKQYIGSSKNIYYRLKRHQSELQRGTHVNPYLLNSYVKYGKDHFVVSIIEEVSIEQLTQKEQEYIDKLKPAYNITLEVIRNTPSEESKRKISATLKKQKLLGILKYPTHDDKKKPVVIYDINCNCIGEYDSERAAARKLEELYPGLKNAQAIVNNRVNLKGKRRKTKIYKKYYLLRPNEKCNTDKLFRSDAIKVKVYDNILKNEYFFPTLKEASKFFKCSISSIKRALIKSRPLLKRYKVKKDES